MSRWLVSAVIAAVGLLHASSAGACPADGVLQCGDAATWGPFTWSGSTSEYQCAPSDWYPGPDSTVELDIPATQAFFVHVAVDTYACTFAGCDGPDPDLFLYERASCVTEWGGQPCADASTNFYLSREYVGGVSDGGSYYAVVDESWGPYGDYEWFDLGVQVYCPQPCDPGLDVAREITCNTVLDDTPVGVSSVLDYYACGDPYDHLPQPEPETIYTFQPQQTGDVTFRLEDMTHDFDIYVLEATCDQTACRASSTQASNTDDSVTFTAQAGITYYIVVEAFDPDAEPEGGTYDLSFDIETTGGCTEICDNGVDDDGDGHVDCEDPGCCGEPACASVPSCCDDADGDGFDAGTCGGSDCDDRPGEGADTWPGAPETCDGMDNDCDGTVDEGTDCHDDDGDGYTEDAGDCDDADASVHPGAIETCDSVDDDCDGTVDEGTDCYDDDGDCYCEAGPCAGSAATCATLLDGDCADGDPARHPAQAEIPDNGVDDDCDGSVDGHVADPDGDGYAAEGGDCAPQDGTAYPGAPEQPDGADDDCDGEIDEGTVAADDDGDGACEGIDLDGDGAPDCSDGSTPGDCDDGDADVHPGAPEVANGVDDDCDGQIDEGTDAVDDDGDGFSEDQGDCDDSSAAVGPHAEEVANDIDDDCDGEIDEGYQDRDDDGWTAAEGDCDDDEGWANPDMHEVCDGFDNDCDGEVDEGCAPEDAPASAETAGGCGCATGPAPSPAWALLFVLPLLRRGRAAAALGLLVLGGCDRDLHVQRLPAELQPVVEVVDLGDVGLAGPVGFDVGIEQVAGAQVQVEYVDVFNLEGDTFSLAPDASLPSLTTGESAAIPLVYAPQAEGWHRAAVTVGSDAEATPEIEIHVRAHAVTPTLAVWPLQVDFGPVPGGDVVQQQVTVANRGPVEVTLGGGTVGAASFSLTDQGPWTVAPEEQIQIGISFAPADRTRAEGELTLASSPPAGAPGVALRGNACEGGDPALYDTDGDGWTSCAGDCMDDDPEAHPGAAERPNDADDDCDGVTDEGTEVYDDDGDCACEAPPCTGSAEPGCALSSEADCHDGAAAVGPHAVEIDGNGVDDDCDGIVDQGSPDMDSDGYSPEGGDCDDTDPTRYPGAPEVPDGDDENCDGSGPSGVDLADEGTVAYDDDGDGWCEVGPCTDGSDPGDCDDRPSAGADTWPGAPETIDGRDQDCDGLVDEGTTVYDDDGDGFTEQAGDCDDADPGVHPAAVEVPGNGIDDDCDPSTPS